MNELYAVHFICISDIPHSMEMISEYLWNIFQPHSHEFELRDHYES